MDDKRFYRDLKREVKKTGNRKRRHFLKDLSADPEEFDFGSAESSVFNGRDGRRKRPNGKKITDKVAAIASSNQNDSVNISECFEGH